ncbi:MATE family efflux transporter [Sulfitobacter mediterraneus]|uniref:MATE family efflux transporter n=1 Tax=Sulfitobacter mediterraneus TaxID=83219 RepID=UPI00055D9AB6|nr:MATE family efflux transporter [Sulfitobacter mediterraneus]
MSLNSSVDPSPQNPFTHGPLGPIFAKTALPIIFVMSMNGLLTVVDAIFLGRYVGAEALGAVTLIFPLFMLIVALATLVSNGMSSKLARHLGAGEHDAARAVFAGAHGLALFAGVLLVLTYLAFGPAVARFLAAGSDTLAEMAQTYLAITMIMSPLLFVLSVNSDALRNEGHVGVMAALSLLVSLLNIMFNYVLIAKLEMGVAGSAYGTALAQLVTLLIVVGFRLSGKTLLTPRALLQTPLTSDWGRILALGAPQSLNFIGVALGSTAILLALQMVNAPQYTATVSAYGIITRVMTFAFLPLLGLTHALQTIVGNNYGARALDRSDRSLRIGIWIAFLYCLGCQVVFVALAQPIARLFVADPAVIEAFEWILQVTTVMFWLAGPMIVIASYFQALGDATRAAVLGLTKPYAFALPLTFALPLVLGELGIWIAGPVSEVLMAILTLLVLSQTARRLNLRYGLFAAARG